MNKALPKNIKGAIFDCDGVLLDSMGFWHNMPSNYVEIQGIIPPEDLIKTIFEMTIDEGISYLRKKYNIEKTEDEIMQEMARFMNQFYLYEVQPKAGIIQVLEQLKAAGIPCAVATSSPRYQIAGALERLDMMKYFDAFFTSSEIGNSKHQPTIYLKAAETLGSQPENTLVFEDTRYAMATANRAGFICIGVYDEVSEYGDPGLKEVSDFYYDTLEDFKL